MNEPKNTAAMAYRPTLARRIWHRLGYRYHLGHYHLGQEPSPVDDQQGFMGHVIRMHFNLADRLRLLVTGRLVIISMMHMDAPNPTVVKTRVDWQIMAPGETRL